MKKNRGNLSDEVKEVAKLYLGREITTMELRLYPYLRFAAQDGFNYEKVNMEELEILLGYEDKGYLLLHGGEIFLSHDFYDFLNGVLACSYVQFLEDTGLVASAPVAES